MEIEENIWWMTASSKSSAVPLDDIRPEINSEGFWATELKPDLQGSDVESEVMLYKVKSYDET